MILYPWGISLGRVDVRLESAHIRNFTRIQLQFSTDAKGNNSYY